jgi:hypothetical protein
MDFDLVRARRRAIPICALVLIFSAWTYAQQTGTARGDGMVPSDHWDYSPPDANHISIAAVMASTKDDIMNVICDPHGAYVSIDPQRPLPSAVDARGLTLAFDGGSPVVQHWKSGTLKGSFGKQDYFEVDQGQPEFQAVIDGLTQHREIDVSITNSGQEIQHQTFTLNGASVAIDHALAACKAK